MVANITPRYNAAELKDYLREQEKLEGREVNPPTWFGLAAARLGLTGLLDRKIFHRLLDNKLPFGKGKLKPRTRKDGKAGDDITFNAPKGVSLAAEFAPNGHQIVEAFREAVTETLAAEAEPYAMTRVRKGGKDEDRVTGEIAGGLHPHLVNRDNEPHLHAHALVLNVTRDPVEERHKAMQAFGIYNRMPEIEADFHRRLRAKVQALGFPTVRRGKYWDIDLPRATINKFSERRQTIKRKFREWGNVTKARRKKVAVMTRQEKPEVIDLGRLREEWREKLTPREKRIFETLQARPKVGRPQRALVARLAAQEYTHDHERNRPAIRER